MKKTSLCTILIALSFCSIAQKVDHATIRVEISNPKSDSLYILTNDDHKIIKILVAREKGIFIDSFKINTDNYILAYGTKKTSLYLENGFDLKLKLDTEMFDETVTYSGIGCVENNYLAQNILYNKKIYFKKSYTLDEPIYMKLLNQTKEDEMKQLAEVKSNPNFQYIQTQLIQKIYNETLEDRKKYHEYILIQSKLNNTTCPSFEYINYNGGKTKLEDLRGKYVLIDIWTTSCPPCIVDIPFLKKIEEDFNKKNIVFVSISVNSQNNYEKWRNFVKDKNLGGVQLFADNSWNSDFMKTCGVISIPRYILIDPTGIIINGNAARPSKPKLRDELNELLN